MFVIGSSEGKEGVIAEECEVVKKIGEVTRKNGREKETLPVWEAEKPMRGQPRWLAKS